MLRRENLAYVVLIRSAFAQLPVATNRNDLSCITDSSQKVSLHLCIKKKQQGGKYHYWVLLIVIFWVVDLEMIHIERIWSLFFFLVTTKSICPDYCNTCDSIRLQYDGQKILNLLVSHYSNFCLHTFLLFLSGLVSA